jgi:hypothetical protein
MELAERLDDYGKAAWIAAMILGFVVFWPIGLGILAYMIGSGRMGCWKYRGPGRWHFNAADEGRSGSRRRRRRNGSPSTGNRAFDEYREETLRRLEDEQREFEGPRTPPKVRKALLTSPRGDLPTQTLPAPGIVMSGAIRCDGLAFPRPSRRYPAGCSSG